MKKFLFAAVAALMLCGGLSAQERNQNGSRRPDPKEMIQRMTDRMVERYGLNADQAKELKTLNEAFVGKMHRAGGPGRGAQARPQGEGQRQAPTEEARRQMEEQRKDYEDGLQKILTKEQYEAYQKDREAMRGRMSSRGRGPRQNENAKDAGSRARSKTTR